MAEKERVLARDDDGYYGIYEGEPVKEKGDWESGQNAVLLCEIFNNKEFHDAFGCHPVRKGRKRRIKRIVIELED